MKPAIFAALVALATPSARAETPATVTDNIFATPDSVEGTLARTAVRRQEENLDYFEWKKQLETDLGLSLGFDHQTQYLGGVVGDSTTDAAANVFRLYGKWTLFNRGKADDGTLVFKVENRSAIGGLVSTQALGPTLGYAGSFASTFSDIGWALTNLYWRQRIFDGRAGFVIGQVDVNDYTNVNALGSPWIGFTNFAFQQQPTMSGPAQGLGAAIQWRLNDKWAVWGGIANANGDASDPWTSAEKLFDSGETYKHVAIGWGPDWADRFDQSVQLTFWQIDERTDAGLPSGQGVSFLAGTRLGNWRPFLRAGYADEAGVSVDRNVSIGTGYDARDGKDLLGLGLGWGRVPGSDRDQITVETFYRYDPNAIFQITPTIQYVADPANSHTTDDIWIFGVRARMVF